MRRDRYLIWMLRGIGLLDLLAVVAVVAPREWIERTALMVGLSEFPNAPIAGYLARETSFWYAAYGLLLWFISFDLERYSQLVTFVAVTLIVQGVIVVGIDFTEGMPIWWTIVEGPCCSVFGVGLLTIQRWVNMESDKPKAVR